MDHLSTQNAGLQTPPPFVSPAAWDNASDCKQRFKVLLIHDGYREFGYELADLQRAGLPADSEVEILTVADLFLPPLYLTDGDVPDFGYYMDHRATGHYGVRLMSELLQRLDAASQIACERATKSFPQWKIRNSTSAELAVSAAIDKATRGQPDLVVIGSDDLSWMERRGLRRLTRRLTAEARCSVRVVRPSAAADRSPGRIMIGFDGSRHAAAALDAVCRREWLPGSQAYLVSCVEPVITDELDWAHDYVEIDRRRMEDLLASAKVRLEELGMSVETLVPIGDPAQTIVDEARRLHIEAIFLGTRDLGLIGSLLGSSVSAAVAARADCSVEITKSPRPPQPQSIEQKLAA